MSDYANPPWYANGPAVYMGADGGFSLRCCPNPEDNARHIVHCVNNHERLVEALFQLVEASENSSESHYVGPKHVNDPWDEARTLLAALEAEKGGEL